MPAMIILVRHALPETQRGVPSVLWGISESAREDTVLLSEHLPVDIGAAIFSSAERKAHETAAVIALRRGLQVVVDERFGEVDRPQVWVEDYRATAEAYLRGNPQPGWEPQGSVTARFDAAVNDVVRANGGKSVVIVDHGLALSLYFTVLRPLVLTRDGAEAFDLVPFWRGLSFPDAWQFDPVDGTVERIFTGGLPPPDA